MRIAQLANFHSPMSGGLRTAVEAVGRGYAAAGHDRVLIIPGPQEGRTQGPDGLLVRVRAPHVGAGYRVVAEPWRIHRLLDELRPDVVEVSDKTTMTTAAGWARRRGARAVLFSHERLDAILSPRLRRAQQGGRLAGTTDRWTRSLARRFDTVVVTSRFAEEEFVRAGALVLGRVVRIPLGVDLATFVPSSVARPATAGPWSPTTTLASSRASAVRPGVARLVHAGRLSRDKEPELLVATLRELVARGRSVHLDIFGDGPQRRELERAAAGLPVTFHGHVGGRAELALRLAAADVALTLCPGETFGLAVLEAMACGTPVVTARTGGAGELVAPDAGLAVTPRAAAYADGVEVLLARPRALRVAAARARAEQYPWARTVSALLEVHTEVHPPGGSGPCLADPRAA